MAGLILLRALELLVVLVLMRVAADWATQAGMLPTRPGWVRAGVAALHRCTEPVLAPVRRALPTRRAGMDLSPAVVVVAACLLQPLTLLL